MKYLFIDTATHDLTIAISSKDEIFSIVTSNNINEHSKYALLEMQNVFNEAGLSPNEVDKVIVVNGPGSFTGVRIGVTIAKTYAWALKKDLVTISSLLVHALAYTDYDYYISAIDARRGNVYAAIYDSNYEPLLDEQHISIDELNDEILKLNGKCIVISDIAIGNHVINAAKCDILRAVDYCQDKPTVMPHALKPRYLKMVEAEEKLKGVQS